MRRLCPACGLGIHPRDRTVSVVRGNAAPDGDLAREADLALVVHEACWEAAELPSMVWSRITAFSQEGGMCKKCRKTHWSCPVCGDAPTDCGERDGPCASCNAKLRHRPA